MNLSRTVILAAMAVGAVCFPSVAQEVEKAYRIRASIYADKKLVTAASWVGVEERRTTVTQTFSTPYRRDIALNEAGTTMDGVLEGKVTMAVRPFAYGGSLCLDVEINSQTVSQLHRYRSEALLEVLPGGGGYNASGDFCEYKETREGLLYDLSLGDDPDYGEILVAPETLVDGAD